MSSKKALGRGLSALLPSTQEDPVTEQGGAERPPSRLYNFEDRVRLLGRVADIEIDKIRPNPYQPRLHFDDQALNELAASIEQLGIIQPITVRALGQGMFEIISGERRWRAARRAGLPRVPAYVREADTEAMLEMALVENVQREELNPIEVALGYQRLIEECSLTQEQVAKKVGKGRATVANILRLLKLPPRVQASLRDGSITVGHARALIPVEDEAAQADLLRQVLEEHLNVRQIEERVRAWHEAQQPDAPAEAEDEPTAVPLPDREALQIQAFTDRLRSQFSTQIQIRHNRDAGSGKIEIAYYSDEDLERLMELLMQG